nr:integrase, catalytic region, zinc finger, CCHC-type, peptidase aspartic, catalytic [Tanacetum cinerariifolium]
PEWSQHVTIVHQTKDLHTADYTQLYDFLKYNQKENGLIGVPGNANLNGNGNLVVARAEGNAAGHNGNQIRSADLDEIKEVDANCILMANLQQASTSGTQTDKAPVYDSDGSTEVHNYENCDDNEIFNMFTQEEQYIELLKPIPEPHQVLQNDNNVISKVTSVEQSGETVEQHPANFEETRALYDSLYHNLANEVEKVNSVNQETLQLAQESHEKMKQLNKEIKPANYTKINHLSGVFVSQMAKSREELYFSNNSKTSNVSKSLSIPNEEFLDDTTPSVARKFLNEVKSTIMTLQRVFKHTMTLETHNWSSFTHQEIYKIVNDENFPIVNQVDARVQNFEIQFLKEAAKFVGDFKSLAKEADESLAKQKALELEIKRLLRAVVSQDIKSVVQKTSVVDTSNLQTELEHTNECFENSYKDMQQKIKRLQAQLGDLKGKSKDTSYVSDTLNPLSQKLKNENVELEFQKDVNYDSNGLSSTRIDNTKIRRPQPRSNRKNDRVPFASKSSRSKNKDAEVEEHHRNLLLSKNMKHMSSACFPDLFMVCRLGLFQTHDRNLNLLINFVWKFMGTVRFENDHVAAILGFGDLQWGNILITRVYFVEGLGHSLFSVGQFCDSDLGSRLEEMLVSSETYKELIC